MTKRAISESGMYISGLRYGVYERTVCPEPASDMPYLTSVHISFAKIFCQNLVKKNCKQGHSVFLKSINIMLGKEYGNGVLLLIL